MSSKRVRDKVWIDLKVKTHLKIRHGTVRFLNI